MTSIKIPPFLKPGDKVGIVAPASVVKYNDLIPGINLLKNEWGLKVVEGKTLKTSSNQFSASDEDRLADFQNMIDDSSIKAVIAARGGYGCSRIVDRIDFTNFRKHPKWIVGFSDLTAFLSQTYNLGFASIHAHMVKSMMQEEAQDARNSLKNALFGELPSYSVSGHSLNRYGKASGDLVGGNLCLLAHLIGSGSDVDTAGKILFIEDVNEYLYNLDRMMIQFRRAGKLANLSGLIVGQFSDMKDNSNPTFGKNADEIISEHVSGYDYPVCFNFPVGHVADNRAMIVGMPAHLNVHKKGVELGFQTQTANTKALTDGIVSK